MAPDVVFEVPVRRDGLEGGTFLAGQAEFLAGFSEMKRAIPRFEFVSVLADDVSASLILRDARGELLTVLIAFDEQRRLKRVTGYRRRAPGAPWKGRKATASM